jgi:hypothetical protein
VSMQEMRNAFSTSLGFSFTSNIKAQLKSNRARLQTTGPCYTKRNQTVVV